MGRRFSKTAAGRDEIKSRAHKITRTARNLLLIVDAARPGSDWVALIHGATPADLDLLLEQGLIEVAHVDAPGAERAAPARSMSEALGALSYDQLYGLLTSQARDRLGLFKGPEDGARGREMQRHRRSAGARGALRRHGARRARRWCRQADAVGARHGGMKHRSKHRR
jgi:hypothetical protein